MERNIRRTDDKSIRKARKIRRRSVVQSLACLVVFCTTYALILPAITLERPTYCGIKEHTHSDECYTMVLVCGKEAGEGHTHDDSCYTEHQNLICGLEETEGHTHTEECYQTFDRLICDLEENEDHTHGEECYEQVTELVCPLEETEGHIHTDACYETVRELTCGLEESEGHTHSEKCYEKKLTCPLEEHEHTLACYSDPKADLETQAEWEETLPKEEELTGVWADDLLKVAESQMDYAESRRNYQVVDEEPMGYTRYGAYYGMPYEDWCAMFIGFCLHYAQIPKEDMPRAASCSKWEKLLTQKDMFLKAEDGRPEPGDLVFFDIDKYEGPDHVGIVTEVDEKDGITTIEGNNGNKVAHHHYKWDDKTLYGYGLLPENPDPEGLGKTEEQKLIEFVGETETMTVRVEAPEDAFPEGTTMEVRTVAAEDVMDAVSDAVDGEISHVDAVDITFFYEDKEIEPALPIQVFMQPKDTKQAGTPQILHLQDDGTTEPVENIADSENSEETVQFEADSFSVYALVYTVDFHWEVDGKTYELSLPGGSYVSLEQLFEVLAASEKAAQAENEEEIPKEDALSLNDVHVSEETKQFMADVENITFTDPSLVWVGKIENDTTVGAIKNAQHLDVQYSAELTEDMIAQMDAQTVAAGDWALISLKAFDSEEYLTVTMKNGDSFQIKVTDSNFASTVDGKTFALLIANSSNTSGYALDASVRNDGRFTSRQTSINYLGETVNEEVYFCENVDSIKWTFEYIKGSGNQFKLKANNGQYLHCENGHFSLSSEPTILYADVTPGDNDHVRLCIDEELHNAINLYGGNNGFSIWSNGNNDPNEKFTLCKPFDMNSNTPGTIDTIDNNLEGIELKLFDYDYIDVPGTTGTLDHDDCRINGDSLNNSNTYNTSVNQNQKFWFLGWGADSNVNNPGINDFTGLDNNIRALQGIVQNNLVDGYPALVVDQNGNAATDSLAYLFDGTANDTRSYTANHLFEKIGDKYSYDSNKHYAEFDTTTGNFTVYDGTLEQNSGRDKNWNKNDKAVGFFPFDKYSDMKGLYDNDRLYLNPNISENEQRKADGTHYRMNHHNGMSLDAHFRLPENMQDSYGNDIEFEFSGDDDLWVYIDDVLVLDIGGVHQPLNGKINFTTGAVTVDAVVAADGVSSDAIAGTNTTIEEMFRKAGKTYDPNKLHEMKVFWIERGGCDSNCKIEFNLPLTTTKEAGAIQFDKVSAKDPSLKLQGAVFTLYTDPDCTTPLVIGNQPVTATSDEDGYVNFYAIPTGPYYIKETTYPEGYQPKDPEEIFTATVTKDTTVHPLKEGAEQEIITNEPKKTEVEVEKLWTSNGQPINAPAGASITVTLGRYKLIEDPNAQGKGTLVIKDSYTGLPNGSNYDVTYTITGPDYSKTIHKAFSEADKEIEISVPKLPAGVQYTVTKQVAPITGVTITNQTGSTTVTVPKNGSVDAEFNESTFNNSAYSITVKSIDKENNQTSIYTWLAPTYYPAGSSVQLRLSYADDSWKRGRRFEYSFDNQNYQDFRINNSGQPNQTGVTDSFTLNQDTTIYVRCKESGNWNHEYDWFRYPAIIGADPVRASSANAPKMMAAGLRASSVITVTASVTPPNDPPQDTLYVLDTEYAEDPDTITLDAAPWTGTAENLDAYNEYGPYVYYIASVSETGVPEGTQVTITDEVFQDGSDNTLTVTNDVPSGKLRIHKSVTYNGVDPATDEQKQALAGTYNFKVYTNADCTVPYQTPQGNEVTLSVTINADGTAQNSATVDLPVGSYWIKEENPSQIGVTPESNNIAVEVTQGSTVDHPAEANFVNNKTEDENPDEMAIDVEKTFTGIDPGKIPSNFHPILTYYLPGSDEPVNITLGPTQGNVERTGEDSLTWKWHVIRIPTDAERFAISEEYFTITGYDRTTYINGGSQNVEHPENPQSVDVLVPVVTTENLQTTSDYTTTDNNKAFYLQDDQILLVRMTNNVTAIVSLKSLSKATRTAIENMLDTNGHKIPGDDSAQANWPDTYVYFSKEVHGTQFSYGGRTIYFIKDGNEDVVAIPHNASNHEVRVDIVYSEGSAGSNSITLLNNYTDTPIDIEIVKIDQKDNTKKLPGAVFTLRQIADEEPQQGGTMASAADTEAKESDPTDANGHTSFRGLTRGYYELTETQSPEGYGNASDVVAYFKVEGGTVTWLVKGEGKPSTWVEKTGKETGEKVSFEGTTFTIENEPGIVLPHTGGYGTKVFKSSGLLMMAAAMLLYGCSQRRRRKGGR